MIVLFTDFGTSDPYLGQVKAVLQRDAPDTPVVDTAVVFCVGRADRERADCFTSGVMAIIPTGG